MTWGLGEITDSTLVLQSDGGSAIGGLLIILFFAVGIGIIVYLYLDGNFESSHSEGGFQYIDYAPEEFLDPFINALDNQLPDSQVGVEFLNGKTLGIFWRETGDELGRITVDEHGHISIEVRDAVGELYEVAEVTTSNYREYTASQVADDVVERFDARASDVVAA